MNKVGSGGFPLDVWADRAPGRAAVLAGNSSITYGALRERSAGLAGLLDRAGLRPGDGVLLFMPNGVEYVTAFFAAMRLGLSIAPAHALAGEAELRQLLEKLRPRLAIVADEGRETQLRTICTALPILRLAPENRCLWEVVEGTAPPASFGAEGRILVSTSGSTGRLKFVSNTYQNEWTNAELYLRRLQVTERDVILAGLPVSQKFGMAAMLGSVLAGCTLVLSARFDARQALSLISKHRVTVQYGVPTMYIREIEAWQTAEEKPDLTSLRTGIIAGAAGAEEVFRWFEDHAGCRLLNCYGTTEIGGLTMAAWDDPPAVRYGTCGRRFDGANIRILGPDGSPLPPGEDGEVVCTVPWAMEGYAEEPDLTARMFDRQGRFLTGDIGRLDEKGNLTISGRKKDLIIRSGYNVFPAEIELALLKLPEIAEACVTGFRDPVLGERICAFVKLRERTASPPTDLRENLSQHLAGYKLPDRVIFLKEIPKLPNGKFDYPALTAMLKEPV